MSVRGGGLAGSCGRQYGAAGREDAGGGCPWRRAWGMRKGLGIFLSVRGELCVGGKLFAGLGQKVALKFSVRALAHLPRTVGRDYFPTDVWMGIRVFPTHHSTINMLTFPTDRLLLFTCFPDRLSATNISNQQSVGESDFSQHTSVGNAVSWCSVCSTGANFPFRSWSQASPFLFCRFILSAGVSLLHCQVGYLIQSQGKIHSSPLLTLFGVQAIIPCRCHPLFEHLALLLLLVPISTMIIYTKYYDPTPQSFIYTDNTTSSKLRHIFNFIGFWIKILV